MSRVRKNEKLLEQVGHMPIHGEEMAVLVALLTDISISLAQIADAVGRDKAEDDLK